MVSVGRHENITLLSYSEVESVSGYVGNFNVRIKNKARYVDGSKCTGCGNCAEVCPVEVSNTFDLGLSKRKAAYRFAAQSVPGAYVIDKKGIAPCRAACPADQRAQGYIALIHQKRYADAYWAIRREHPFPSVCGRVCNHRCEDHCSRGKVDEPVSIMRLKRFVTDWAYEHRFELKKMVNKSLIGTPFQVKHAPSGKKVAVIGAGPAGLTAALDLVRLGHSVTVFDALAVAGGMMRVGIPPHRLPYEYLDWEVEQILEEGVELKLNTWIEDIAGLMKSGYESVVIATGAHNASKLMITGSDHPDNWLSLELLRRACLGVELDLSGREIIVIGAGDVALDSARTAIRLGSPVVKIVCRGMRASKHELEEAEAEGIKIIRDRVFKEVVIKNNKIIGVLCLEARVGEIVNGKRQLQEIPGTDHIIPGNLIIWAVGQWPDFSFLPRDGTIATRYPDGLWSDGNLMTTLPGVFVAGDVRRGMTTFVVDAVGEGHHIGRTVDRYLRRPGGGVPEPIKLDVSQLEEDEVRTRIEEGDVSSAARAKVHTLAIEERVNNFREVDLPMTEAEALSEAARCLSCGTCSECLECLGACDRGAINHEMKDEILNVNVGTIILATGFKDFDPSIAPELGYGVLDNVLTAMEFERLINSSGPTTGKVMLKNGHAPRSVAILHCVGSRDKKYHDYCSRACCMYSLKLSQLVHEYVGAEVYEIYRDMRSFGKGYEEFYNRTEKMGVNFYHGLVKGIKKKGRKLQVSWSESYYNQPNHVEVDMVILATGFEPQKDAANVAGTFGISRSGSGFFQERHPKLAPVETTSEGIYLAGACQSPKDIPDSVAQAGAAAAAALSLIDQGTIALDPVVAEVKKVLCTGCGLCSEACPYGSIHVENRTSVVNTFLCKGCGTCSAACRNKAITLIHYDDRQVINELVGMLAEDQVVC